ncbi:MAG TPA: pyridoxal 5'-phosphate synthase glutaminase subunit PdxT [Acidimicrobiales bacterium]|nr:MAG: pyridoxal 5'-phosphate synthase glutaminase subunit PdxT [Actinobacteria bacterium 21-73-9]HQU25648.1 pyridoxal 5'-phosphate synthase glutaminase subunit PdxT [Acidimicrobiales bacterium]
MGSVGVLALQGDVREHLATLTALGVEAVRVRTPDELESVDALVLPGGESTAIAHLLVTAGLRDPVGARLAAGMPVLGTCAGLILLARDVLDGRADQWGFGALEVAVRRNGYGRQIASFEAPLTLADGSSVPGVFIRAPRILECGPGVEVLATYAHGGGSDAVLVRQGPVWGASFHPELTADTTVHRLFVGSL